MARRRGQVDEKKSEAILDAAAALFADKGLQAKMDEIAKLAGVSKQTVYNRFASKLEIAQALAAKRVEDIVAPLRTAGDPQTVLETLALTLLNRVCSADKVGSMRGVALISTEAPEIAHAIYEAGPKRSLREMAAWLAEQTRLGRLEVADPEQAAEMFSGPGAGPRPSARHAGRAAAGAREARGAGQGGRAHLRGRPCSPNRPSPRRFRRLPDPGRANVGAYRKVKARPC